MEIFERKGSALTGYCIKFDTQPQLKLDCDWWWTQENNFYWLCFWNKSDCEKLILRVSA
jgi:hypothetical protein